MRDAGEGPAVVLLHAFPCDASMWQGQVPALVSAGCRVLVPDLPGFGSSPLPADPPDLDVVAASIVEALADIGVSRFALAGLSLGGYLAMALLRLAPEQVSALALVDTKARTDPEPARENRLLVAEQAMAEHSTEFLVSAMIPGLLGRTSRDTRPQVVALTEEWIRGAAPETVAWYQRAMAQRPDSLADLLTFPGPGLVVYGEEDTVLSPREEQLLMAGALRDSRIVEIAAAGHLSAVEQPGAVAAALADFMGGLTG
jgi:pimeloyl-ACP methyl ester carboxylesterase